MFENLYKRRLEKRPAVKENAYQKTGDKILPLPVFGQRKKARNEDVSQRLIAREIIQRRKTRFLTGGSVGAREG